MLAGQIAMVLVMTMTPLHMHHHGASLPAIEHCLKAGAAVMVTSHLGRPTEGQVRPEDSLAPVAQRLSQLLGREVPLVQNWVEDGVRVAPYDHARDSLGALEDGDVLLVDPRRITAGMRAAVPEKVKVVEAVNPTTFAKSRKTEAEAARSRRVERIFQQQPDRIRTDEGALERGKHDDGRELERAVRE